MSQAQKMQGFQAISGGQAECYAIRDGKRVNCMNAIKLEANLELETEDVPILGRTTKGTKATGMKLSGSAEFHFNSPYFNEIAMEFQKTGKMTYFDFQVTTEDKTAANGRHTVILKNVLLNSLPLIKFDADGGYLVQEIDFTFESWEEPESFSMLAGME